MASNRPEKQVIILKAATQLFLEEGFQKVSIRNIIERANCSRETIYRYFKSKEEIFASAINLQMDIYLDTIQSITMGEADDLRQGLINWSVSLIQTVTSEEYIQFRRLVFSEATSRPEHGSLYYELTYEKGTSAVAEFLKRGQQKGELKPVEPRRLAAYFVGMLLYELVHQRLLNMRKKPSQPQINKLVKTTVDDFLLGYGL